jgi:hypothetical protein
LDSETIDGKQIYSAMYLREDDKKYDNGLPIQFNFSPSLAFDGNLVIVASTNALAKKARSKSTTQNEPIAEVKNNTALNVDFGALKHTLEANRLQMISQNMLEKGHSKLEAEKEIDTLLSLLSLLRHGTAALKFDDQVRLQLDLEIHADQ